MKEEEKQLKLEKQWFITSRKGNIKEEFYFEKKLGSGGYGTVYQARKKDTGKRIVMSRRIGRHQSHLEVGSQRLRELPKRNQHSEESGRLASL